MRPKEQAAEYEQTRPKGRNNPIINPLKMKETMEEKSNMTAERSLEIIRESIERSQRTITKNIALPLIWWGCVVAVFSFIIVYLWSCHGGPVWNVLWAVMGLVGYVGNRMIDKRKIATPPTFVGKTIDHIWDTFGIVCGTLGGIVCCVGFGWLPIEVLGQGCGFNITAVISLCFGMATAIMGFVLKSTIIRICGILASIGGFFGAMQFMGHEQLYVMVAVAIVALIVPGIVIYLQNKE